MSMKIPNSLNPEKSAGMPIKIVIVSLSHNDESTVELHMIATGNFSEGGMRLEIMIFSSFWLIGTSNSEDLFSRNMAGPVSFSLTLSFWLCMFLTSTGTSSLEPKVI